MKENNPFNPDKWNIKENLALYRGHGNPYQCKNFFCEISFGDWNPVEKEEYLKIRNKKRVVAVEKTKVDKVAGVRAQRDNIIAAMKAKGISTKELSKVTGLGIRMIDKIGKSSNTV